MKSEDISEAQALEIARLLKSKDVISVKFAPASSSKKKLVEFLLEFWDHDNSLYLRDKRARGKSVTQRTCVEARRAIKRDWLPYFGEKQLSEITRNELREFGFFLRGRLSGKTVNNVLHFGTTALKWAYREKIIPENITEGLGGFFGGERKRDIFTPEEFLKLHDVKYWESKKAYAAFRLAGSSALRSGECLALRRQDIGEGVVYVRHGYNNIDGLKQTKNREEGTVYLLPEVRGLLRELLEENPTKESGEQYVFFSDVNPKKPCGAALFVKWLHRAMKNAGIEPAGRRLDFHSLRHYVATKWADETGNLRQVAKVTRHKDIKQAARYSDHAHENEIAAMGETAANILQFRKGA